MSSLSASDLKSKGFFLFRSKVQQSHEDKSTEGEAGYIPQLHLCGMYVVYLLICTFPLNKGATIKTSICRYYYKGLTLKHFKC